MRENDTGDEEITVNEEIIGVKRRIKAGPLTKHAIEKAEKAKSE